MQSLRGPRRSCHVSPKSPREFSAGTRTAVGLRVGPRRAQRRRARDGNRAAPTGDSASLRYEAAGRSGERAGLGAVPCGPAGGGDDRSHSSHRRLTRERAGAGIASASDPLGCCERQHCSLASSPDNGERFVVTTRRPRTTGERLQVAVAAYDAARAGTADEARELALRAFANGKMLDDPGPESGGFWIVPSVLLLAYADDDGERVCTEVIEWANHHGSLPAFAMAARLRAYIYLRRGALAEAEADAASAHEHPGLPRAFPRTAPLRSSTSCSPGASRSKPPRSSLGLCRARQQPVASATCRPALACMRLRITSTKR